MAEIIGDEKLHVESITCRCEVNRKDTTTVQACTDTISHDVSA